MTETMEITAAMVGALRESTGAPLMKCKAALLEAAGDLTRAAELLRQQGVKTAPVENVGNQGYIAVYVHPGSQVVGMVELACATDFVARSDEFRRVAGELAMQVAATSPSAVTPDDLPASVREDEIRIARMQVDRDPRTASKPESLRTEIAQRKAEDGIRERCLLTQAYVRDANVTVGALIDDLRLRVREGVYVRRFARWRVGEPV